MICYFSRNYEILNFSNIKQCTRNWELFEENTCFPQQICTNMTSAFDNNTLSASLLSMLVVAKFHYYQIYIFGKIFKRNIYMAVHFENMTWLHFCRAFYMVTFAFAYTKDYNTSLILNKPNIQIKSYTNERERLVSLFQTSFMLLVWPFIITFLNVPHQRYRLPYQRMFFFFIVLAAWKGICYYIPACRLRDSRSIENFLTMWMIKINS